MTYTPGTLSHQKGANMDFSMNEEQRLWRQAVRDFAQAEIAPRVREIDTEERIPPEIIQGSRGIRSYSIGAEGTMNIMRLVIVRELLRAEFLPYKD